MFLPRIGKIERHLTKLSQKDDVFFWDTVYNRLIVFSTIDIILCAGDHSDSSDDSDDSDGGKGGGGSLGKFIRNLLQQQVDSRV